MENIFSPTPSNFDAALFGILYGIAILGLLISAGHAGWKVIQRFRIRQGVASPNHPYLPHPYPDKSHYQSVLAKSSK